MIRLSVGVPMDVALTLDPKAKKKALRQAGQQVARATRRRLSKAGAGRRYGKHVASAPGQPPAKMTGGLASSVTVRVWKSGDGVAIRARRFYALFLEAGAQGGVGSGRKGVKGKSNTRHRVAGTRELKPRPFLSAALEELSGERLGERLRDAIAKGIELRKGARKRAR